MTLPVAAPNLVERERGGRFLNRGLLALAQGIIAGAFIIAPESVSSKKGITAKKLPVQWREEGPPVLMGFMRLIWSGREMGLYFQGGTLRKCPDRFSRSVGDPLAGT
ncbi:hypothetical protein CDAR_214201 [Caerostris darwini]|uniref:Uncharacterized protein n=1 Tax=Caerostris darwini TaxID=1538125 RepID=A0AAV4S6P7_9ARAC|nr:hypothetical protein CDAR_214201 [Caerostris darwini]